VSTCALIPGAGGAAWCWHRVVPLLAAAGHDAVPVDLPGDDPSASVPDYARLLTNAIGAQAGQQAQDDVILVAMSLGGFTAPLVSARIPPTKGRCAPTREA
jgi:pimeloyl-ACP methyl ester carboxylesterase